ncbi:hypothetical protein LguiB_014048 [Lonicera macranthoides]
MDLSKCYRQLEYKDLHAKIWSCSFNSVTQCYNPVRCSRCEAKPLFRYENTGDILMDSSTACKS